MPYASVHYPFENSDHFHGDMFPADFIAEGLDQTRGWFYTLTVLGNKLFNVSPFKNCIVNGIVLAEDGKKMSKSLKNFPDPSTILELYGADALRLYLINSPVVRAEPIRFKESGVREIVSRVLLPLWNSYRFFSEQAILYKKSSGRDFIAQPLVHDELANVMDRWIVADCQSLLRFMDQEMLGKHRISTRLMERTLLTLLKGYRLYTVVPRLLEVIDNLTNWYIRFNRKRLKGGAGLGDEDTTTALNTLFQVLFTIVRALAPFTPFLTEHIYGLLKPHLGDDVVAQFKDSRSVHFLPFPTVDEALFDEIIERKVSAMQKVIQLARAARERCGMTLKTPLPSLVVIADQQHLSDVESLLTYIKEELNIRNVVLTSEEEQYNIVLQARVDWPTLGKKLKKDVQVVRKALPGLTQDQLRDYLRDGKMTINGIELTDNDLSIVRVLGEQHTANANANSSSSAPSEEQQGPKWEAAFENDMIILLDTTPLPEHVDERLAREMISRVQKLRKKAGLVPTDDIHMQYNVVSNQDDVDVDAVVSSRQLLFEGSLRGTLEKVPVPVPTEGGDGGGQESLILEEEQSVGGLTLLIRLVKI